MNFFKSKYWILFWNFFKIAIVSVGGGLVMIPLIEDAFVKKHRLISHEDLLDCVALNQSMPGVIAANMSAYIGMKVAGFFGALIACFGVVLPPFLVITVIAMLFGKLEGVAEVDQIFAGVRAAVSALILVSALKLAKKIFIGKVAKIVTISAFLLLVFTRIDAIIIILGGGVLGILITFYSTHAAGKKQEDNK
jgi:chromate transporter